MTVAASTPERSSAEVLDGVEPPRWLSLAAFLAASGVLALGSVGLALAMNGWYRPGLAFAIGGIAWLGLLALARPLFAQAGGAPVTRRAHVYAGTGVAAIVAIMAWNMVNASQHVLIDRDGGSYTNTARWIARDGSLSVDARVGPFANEQSVVFNSPAVYQMSDGSLQFQFAHLLPVVLAEAYAVAGNAGLFHTPELLGAFAMLAFFVLAWRLLRNPLFALSAMLALALILPEVSFARDSYSEIPSQIVLFTALWILVTRRVLPRARLALIAGLFLGALEALRVDAIVFLIGIPPLCAIAWLRSGTADRRRTTLVSIGALVAGLVPGLTLGLVDLTRHSGGYYNSLSSDVRDLALATAASLFVCAVGVAGWRFMFPMLRRLPWSRISSLAAVLVAVSGFGVWAFRPRLQHMRGDASAILGLQRVEHVTVDATRLYFERSMSWMAWYLGPVTLGLAIVGAALLVRALLLGRSIRTVGVLAVMAPGCLLYLYRASAVPDHVWVTRRFLVSALPILVLLALGLASHLSNVRSTTRWGRAGRVGAIVIAVGSVAYPVYTIIPVSSMAEETGYLSAVEGVCNDIGPHAAVVVLEAAPTDELDDWIPQAIRGWCGAEVASTRGAAQPDALRRLAREWSDEGRSFFVVSSSEGYVRKVLPDAERTSTFRAVDTRLLAPTLTHRPDSYRSQSVVIVVAGVPLG